MSSTGLFAAMTPGQQSLTLGGALEGLLSASEKTDAAGGDFMDILAAAMAPQEASVTLAPAQADGSKTGTKTGTKPGVAAAEEDPALTAQSVQTTTARSSAIKTAQAVSETADGPALQIAAADAGPPAPAAGKTAQAADQTEETPHARPALDAVDPEKAAAPVIVTLPPALAALVASAQPNAAGGAQFGGAEPHKPILSLTPFAAAARPAEAPETKTAPAGPEALEAQSMAAVLNRAPKPFTPPAAAAAMVAAVRETSTPVKVRGVVVASEAPAPETTPAATTEDAPSPAATLVIAQQIAAGESPIQRPAFRDHPAKTQHAASAAVAPINADTSPLAETDPALAPSGRPVALATSASAPAETALDRPDPGFTVETPQDAAPHADHDPAAQAAALQSQPSAPAAPLPAATSQTVTQLANHIAAAQAGGAKASRFTVQLDPVGLGKVDVRVEISAAGELSAALNFQNPHSAQELSARASELQSALQQAGFDPSKTALSFNNDAGGGQSGQSGQSLLGQQHEQQRQGEPASWRQAGFVNLADAPEISALAYRSVRDGGVDVTI